jgi:glycosyltransferase involved in cell wall biosynthesis/peptidoglycan/xylan/chitin deacetylase (PgdA/CDA1 family)
MFKISVVIPTFNRRHVLERTLPTLEAQDLASSEFEVLVVDNGSTDRTLEFLKGWNPPFAFRPLQVLRRGASAARNAGIFAASGELILFLDDDLLAIPNLLSQHCAAHDDASEPHIVHGPIYVAPGSAKTIIRHITEHFYGEYNRSLTADMELRYPEDIGPKIAMLSSMVNSSIPRLELLRCGGFDEEILAAEDLELGMRLWKMGLPLHCRPAAFVREFYVKTSRNYLRNQAPAAGMGDWRIVHKHPEYRPYSSLASFGETRAGKRWLRNLLMRFPLSPVPLMAIPLRLERFFFGNSLLRTLGERIFHFAERIQRLRSELRAAGSWEQLLIEYDRRLPVLIYHHVGPVRPGISGEWSISPKQFERQIRRIAHAGYETVWPSDWLGWLREGKELPKKAVLITFDDAYSDTALFALPILRRYKMKAAVFVVTGRVGGTNTWDEEQGSGTLHLMSAEQIREWACAGIEFGAHSRTHTNLTTLSGAELMAEVSGSRDDLAAITGVPVLSFAYPFGEQTEAVRAMASKAFELAFGSEEGLNYLRSDRHSLKRTYIGANTSPMALLLILRFGSLKKLNEWRGRLAIRTRLRLLLAWRHRLL